VLFDLNCWSQRILFKGIVRERQPGRYAQRRLGLGGLPTSCLTWDGNDRIPCIVY